MALLLDFRSGPLPVAGDYGDSPDEAGFAMNATIRPADALWMTLASITLANPA
jgi:hypothetical protein